jgi:hypothetical protein
MELPVPTALKEPQALLDLLDSLVHQATLVSKVRKGLRALSARPEQME